MPFGKRKKDIDLSVHPETKYNRILYTADRRTSTDDDLPPVTRRRRARGRQEREPVFFFPREAP